MAFDIKNLQWSEEILEAAELSEELFSEPVYAGTPVGTIKVSIAEELGFLNSPMMLQAGHDQVAAAIGL